MSDAEVKSITITLHTVDGKPVTYHLTRWKSLRRVQKMLDKIFPSIDVDSLVIDLQDDARPSDDAWPPAPDLDESAFEK